MSRLTSLALTVAQAKRQGRPAARGGEVDRAMDELAPFIKETAQRIHGRYYSLRRQLASDFVSHAPAMVWTRIEHFADWYFQELPAAARKEDAKDFFAAWCYRELHFRYLDVGRGQKAEPKVKALEGASAGDLADHRSGTDEPSVYDFELSAADTRQLGEWDPLDGVILFALAGQWAQVPAELWGGWLAELSLKPPFPPPEFEAVPKVKRRACLAQALHVSRDVIFQRWHRLKEKYLA
ncbi:MAG TPA: hypothetical protein VH475_11550 [Tepidisphaeraceae bacterium]|jgi:hypothetical protein